MWFDDQHAEAASSHTAEVGASLADRAGEAMQHYLDKGHLFQHVQDATYFEVPRFLGERWNIPQLPGISNGLHWGELTLLNGKITKFMVLEVVAALLIVFAYTWLARRVKSGDAPKGRIWNFLEVFVVFVRDNIARPSIGKHDADRFTPFLLTLFLFILVLNLLGMIPFLGSATGDVSVTAVFAFATFLVVVGSGMQKMGVLGFIKAQLPHVELHPAMAMVLKPGLLALELFGLCIKHFVLCIRLFANMFAGHLVLAVFVGLIGVVWVAAWLFYSVTPVIILAAVAISLLELFVAFLQAYVFTYLSALFIGFAQHAH